jgi:hypothetical protein
MEFLNVTVPINGISCRKRGDAVRINRTVVGTKWVDVLHFFLLSNLINIKSS